MSEPTFEDVMAQRRDEEEALSTKLARQARAEARERSKELRRLKAEAKSKAP